MPNEEGKMQLVEKIGETFNKTGKDVFQLIDAAQIKRWIEEEKGERQKAVERLGESCYGQIKENPPEQYRESVSEILGCERRIHEYEDRLEELTRKKNCSYCGAELVDGAGFCAQCGKKVVRETVKKCPSCGGKIEEGDLFCAGCGKRIER